MRHTSWALLACEPREGSDWDTMHAALLEVLHQTFWRLLRYKVHFWVQLRNSWLDEWQPGTPARVPTHVSVVCGCLWGGV